VGGTWKGAFVRSENNLENKRPLLLDLAKEICGSSDFHAIEEAHKEVGEGGSTFEWGEGEMVTGKRKLRNRSVQVQRNPVLGRRGPVQVHLRGRGESIRLEKKKQPIFTGNKS